MSEPKKNRRVDDDRISLLISQAEESHRTHIRTRVLVDDVLWLRGEQAKINAAVDVNTARLIDLLAVTGQVRDILITFKVLHAVSKWIAAIGAACGALYYGWTHIK